MERPGADLIRHYLNPDRLPAWLPAGSVTRLTRYVPASIALLLPASMVARRVLDRDWFAALLTRQ
jgi:hypothetical protein